MDDAPEEVGRREPFVGRVAQQAVDLGTDVRAEPRLVDRAHVGDERQLLDEGSIAGFGLTQTGDSLTPFVQGALELFRLLRQPIAPVLQGVRDLMEDREERTEEQQQRQAERECDRLDRRYDLGFDRAVVVVELENASRPLLVRETEWHVGRDDLDVLPLPTFVVEPARFPHCSSREHFIQFLGVDPRPDQGVVVGIRDRSVAPPELRAHDAVHELRREEGIKGRESLRGDDRFSEICLAQLG
jgi:hypothetical protein